jgi:hypothetical protein
MRIRVCDGRSGSLGTPSNAATSSAQLAAGLNAIRRASDVDGKIDGPLWPVCPSSCPTPKVEFMNRLRASVVSNSELRS